MNGLGVVGFREYPILTQKRAQTEAEFRKTQTQGCWSCEKIPEMGFLGWGNRLHGTESMASLVAVMVAVTRRTEAGGQSLATRDSTWTGTERRKGTRIRILTGF